MLYLVACNNAVLAVFFRIAKSLLSLMQIIGPLLAMASLVYLLIKMMQNPEDKKLTKKIFNSCLALVILFFVPLLVTVVLNMVDDSSEFGACWKSASTTGSFSNPGYIDTGDNNRVNIIGGSQYEKGQANSNNNGSNNNSNSNTNSNINTNNNTNNSSSSNTKPIVNNGGKRVIFIGDSRTVQMYSYVANTWKNNSYSTGGINQVGNDLFVAQGSMGLSWMQNTGIPAAKQYFKSGVAIVILMGVNDLRNQDNYISYLNSNVSSWTSSGAKVYFVSVNPCDGDYAHMNSRISTFNSNLKKGLSNKIGWINTHDNLTFKTVDGLHYNQDTSIKIYNYIKNKV